MNGHLSRAVRIACLIVVASGSSHARAQDKAACLAAHEEGQVARKASRLLDARDRFRICANTPCPPALQRDCAVWHQQVDEQIPSLVFEARDDRGRDIEGTKVEVDGAPVGARALTAPREVDPGTHVVRFVLPDNKVVERSISVRPGDKGRVVALKLDAPRGPSPSPTPSPLGPTSLPEPSRDSRAVPPLAFVFGGVAIASLGVFGGFALSGLSKEEALESGPTACAPLCEQRRLDPIKTNYLIADIGLGVSVVAVAATVWVLLSRGDRARREPVAAAVQR